MFQQFFFLGGGGGEGPYTFGRDSSAYTCKNNLRATYDLRHFLVCKGCVIAILFTFSWCLLQSPKFNPKASYFWCRLNFKIILNLTMIIFLFWYFLF